MPQSTPLRPRSRAREEPEASSVASSLAGSPDRMANKGQPAPWGRPLVQDWAAKDFTGGIERWVGEPRAEPPAQPPRRVKLPSDKGRLSANFLYRSSNSADAALCAEERRDEAGKKIVTAMNTRATSLDLENLGLKGLPAQIGDLAGLRELNLNFNRLQSLPPEISKLGRLKVLQAGGVNELARFPMDILSLKKLSHLDLSGNRLRSVPPEVGELTELTQLFLDSNLLERLPAELYRLSKLKVFSAGSNPFITSVPADMGDLAQLKRVDLSNTQIATLPVKWNSRVENSLVSLNLSHTNFTGFADDSNIKMPKHMKLLDLSFTRAVTLPPSFGPLTFFGNAEGNILRTTHKRLWDANLKIKVEATNLPAELAREGRMVTDQPIPQLTAIRRQDRRNATDNQDNDVDSGSDDGEDLDFDLRYLGDTGPVNLVHAQRVREAALNRLPTGRAADFAAERAAEEFADRWGEPPPAQPATLFPWGNDPAPPWPGVPRQVPLQPGTQPPGVLPPVQPGVQLGVQLGALIGAQLANAQGVQSGAQLGALLGTYMESQLGMQVGMQAGVQPGRWSNRLQHPQNPEYLLPPPVQPFMPAWAQPPMPFGVGYGLAGAQQPGLGLQFPAAQNPLWMGTGQFNPFAQMLQPGAMPMQAAPFQNNPLPQQQGAMLPPQGAMPPSGAVPAPAGGAPSPGITSLSPYVTPGARARPPTWAPQPTWWDTASDWVAANVLRR